MDTIHACVVFLLQCRLQNVTIYLLIRLLRSAKTRQLAGCLIYARALIEYVIFILWVRSVSNMLPSVTFAEDKVLTFLILREKNAKIVQF